MVRVGVWKSTCQEIEARIKGKGEIRPSVIVKLNMTLSLNR